MGSVERNVFIIEIYPVCYRSLESRLLYDPIDEGLAAAELLYTRTLPENTEDTTPIISVTLQICQSWMNIVRQYIEAPPSFYKVSHAIDLCIIIR